jgi:hypothetical protein
MYVRVCTDMPLAGAWTAGQILFTIVKAAYCTRQHSSKSMDSSNGLRTQNTSFLESGCNDFDKMLEFHKDHLTK